MDREDVVAAYLAGALDDAARDEFEAHLLLCDQCQNELRFLAALRQRAGTVPRASRLAVWVGLAAAAAIVGFLVVSATGVDVTRFGRVDAAPVYLGLPVRGGNPADSAFETGMRYYDASRWADASASLRRAAALGADHDATWFFLGASELMSGNDVAADSAFLRAVAAGEGPYTTEARFYRAKTLLRRRQRDAALAELTRIPARAPIGAHAAALADSIRSHRIR
jgi:uncharacterized protein HemY